MCTLQTLLYPMRSEVNKRALRDADSLATSINSCIRLGPRLPPCNSKCLVMVNENHPPNGPALFKFVYHMGTTSLNFSLDRMNVAAPQN